MTVKDIVIEHLKFISANGLSSTDCGCSIDDLMPCGYSPDNCVPAKGIACKPDCPNCDGLGCFVPMKDE